ncbi:MAG: GNAT family N-acetyltransferase, partial [Collinsella sp.]
FNIAMQLQRSPIALVAEAEGRIIAACCIGIFEDGKPRTNPTWESCYNEMLAQATEMAKAADAKLEGSLFGDSREKATADRFAATGNEYAQGQLNLIIIVPEWQGKGLGRALIDLARAELAKAGCQVLPDERLQLRLAVLQHLNMKRILEDAQSRHRRRFYRLQVRRRHAGLTR